MFVLDRVRTELLSLPALTRIGLVIMVVGGLADVAAHLAAAVEAEHVHEHTGPELSAHLIGFLGMVVVLLGVVIDGIRRTLHDRSVEHEPAIFRASDLT